MKNSKMISIAAISLLVLSMFFASVVVADPITLDGLLSWLKSNVRAKMLTKTDHALFDTTVGDTGARVKSPKTFDFHLVARALSDGTTIRITFGDGDWIEFVLQTNEVLSFTQAAGGTPVVDGELIVSVTSGDAVGWVSIRTEYGASAPTALPYSGSFCVTT